MELRNKITPACLIICLVAMLGLFTSCEREDDVNEIFAGKTWYMNGATINGMQWNSEIKTFYQYGNEAYKISFSSSTFQATLSQGSSFSGTWSADGKSQSLTLNVTNPITPQNNNDRMLYNILTNIKSYRSGANFLRISKDGNNVIMFADARDKIIN